MIGWLEHLLYGSVSAEFHSAFGMQESVERLKAATVKSTLLSHNNQSAVGTVSEKKVSLQRVIPMASNSFKPFFKGHFKVSDGRVVLVGRFTMLWFVKAFMTFWLGFCVFWTAMAAFAVATKKAPGWWFPLAGVAMFCIGVAFVRGCQWLARNDIAWLSELIIKALASVPPNQAFKPTAANSRGVGLI